MLEATSEMQFGRLRYEESRPEYVPDAPSEGD